MTNILNETGKLYNVSQINIIANGFSKEMIEEAEILYKDKVKSTAISILEQKNDYNVVLLAGPSGSGKTTTSKILCETIKKLGEQAIALSMDDFYMGFKRMPIGENGKKDFESVYAIDIPKFKNTLYELLLNGSAEIPKYNFSKSEPFDFTNKVILAKGSVAIIEGIHAFNPIFTEGENLNNGLTKLYVSVENSISCGCNKILKDSDIRFLRRLIRDKFFRNSSAERTLDMWEDVVKGENKNIFPYKQNGDYYINSFHIYEVCVFKKYVIDLLSKVDKSRKDYSFAEHILDCVSEFNDINSEIVPLNSLVREFIGNSSYYM